MPRMISTAHHTYGNKALKPGDEFKPESVEHEELLVRLNRAKRKENKRGTYKTRDMQAETTRDLRSEDES